MVYTSFRANHILFVYMENIEYFRKVPDVLNNFLVACPQNIMKSNASIMIITCKGILRFK